LHPKKNYASDIYWIQDRISVTMTHTLSIEYDDAVLLSAGLHEQEFNREARLLLAAKLYELGRLSSGQSARLCGMSRVAFLCALPQAGVPISNIRAEDALLEIETLQHA